MSMSVMIPFRQLARSFHVKPSITSYSLRFRSFHISPIRYTTVDTNSLPQTSGDLQGHVSPAIIESLNRNKFTNLTPIQQLSILPLINTKNGMVCRAKTGTGKTLTFIIPTLESAISRKTPGVDTLVIAPTRDLAQQIYEEYVKVISKLPNDVRKPGVALITGGRSGRINFRNPESIVIATPGRLAADLRDRQAAELFDSLSFRVYDEADRLLDIGFEQTLDEIHDSIIRVRANPKTPLKSLLFSATIDDSMTNFAEKHINSNYDYINTVNEDDTNVHENIHQILIQCQDSVDKYQTAISYIVDAIHEDHFRGIVFLPTKASVDWFEDYMKLLSNSQAFEEGKLFGHRAPAQILKIHGGLSVNKRENALRIFKNSPKALLVATDVIARGIDVKDVTHVFQFGPSDDPLDYVHKVGRTGRAGKKGKAILFLTEAERKYVRTLKDVAQVTFQETVASNELNQRDIYQYEADFQETRSFIVPNLSYLNQICDKYRLNLSDLVEENLIFLRKVTGVQDGTISVSGHVASSLKRIDRRIFKEFFSSGHNRGYGGYRDGAYSRSGGDWRDSKQGSYARSGGNRGGYNRGYNNQDRGFNRGYDRGFNRDKNSNRKYRDEISDLFD